ncbi:MAG: nitroreductase family protein [Oscillospiraceae bacterium]|nr:nitroreductase family protein [Oscillospiraceae bacterium]MBQ3878677.1 nitroreductase family protein [Oscillospiraceae bacterium]
MLTTLETINKRSSIRAYTDEKLTKEEIAALVDAGLRAPTAANRQELHFSVLEHGCPLLKELEDEKNRLNNASPEKNFYYSAPVVILISGDTAFHWSDLDAGIAVENISLLAESMGLGSLIIGCIRDAMHGEKQAYFEKAFDFPAGYDYKIAIALGHRATEKVQHTYDEGKQVSYIG